MKKLLLSILVLISLNISAQELNKRDSALILKNCRTIITEYATQLNLIGSKDETDESKYYYTEALYKLFGSQNTIVFNDLDPTGKTSKELTIEDYRDKITLWYSAIGLNTVIEEKNIVLHKVETTADGKTFMRLFVSKQVKTIVVLIAMVIYR